MRGNGRRISLKDNGGQWCHRERELTGGEIHPGRETKWIQHRPHDKVANAGETYDKQRNGTHINYVDLNVRLSEGMHVWQVVFVGVLAPKTQMSTVSHVVMVTIRTAINKTEIC